MMPYGIMFVLGCTTAMIIISSFKAGQAVPIKASRNKAASIPLIFLDCQPCNAVLGIPLESKCDNCSIGVAIRDMN